MSTKGGSKFDKIMTRSAGATSLSIGEKSIEGAIMLPIGKLVPNFFQVRQDFDEETLSELAEDIRSRGILEPLVVRQLEPGQYEIIAGERRYRAAQMAGLEELPVIVKLMNDKDARLATLAENLQRKDLTDEEERRFYQQLANEFNFSATQIAQTINKSARYVQRKLYGEDPRPNSEISNNNDDLTQLSSVSQSFGNGSNVTRITSPARFNPAVFKRVNQVFDTALEAVKAQPDPDTLKLIRESVADAKQKLAKLEKELEEAEGGA